MKLTITRPPDWQTHPASTGTPGTAQLDNGLFFDSLELPWKNNQPDVSCIPAGVYQAALAWMPHFGKDMYLLQDVPGRNSVFIHPGNWAGDVSQGLRSDVEGCILLGLSTGEIEGQEGVCESVTAIDRFMAACGGQPITVVIS